MLIDAETREKAARICDAASKSTEASLQHYAKTAEGLGLEVKYVDDGAWGDGSGPDMEAVELAARAYLTVDPEPLGIESVEDPRRDAEAARMLRAGWEPK